MDEICDFLNDVRIAPEHILLLSCQIQHLYLILT